MNEHRLTFEELQAMARKLVGVLGITLYVRDGWIYQNGPGEAIDPLASAKPTVAHGRFELSRVEPKI